MKKVDSWQPHLSSYKKLRALKFLNDSDAAKAIDLLWSRQLRKCPHDMARAKVFIVPQKAVKYFKKAGLKFENLPVLSSSDLPAKELNALRREQGPY